MSREVPEDSVALTLAVRRRGRLALATLLLAVVACEPAGSAHATVRDSAGITLVSVTLPDRPPTLELVPIDTLGTSPEGA